MKLIILNGPPGVGKSTVAARLHEEIQSSVLVDVDGLRRAVHDYKEHREESLLMAYKLTTDAILNQLMNGQDVIIDKAVSEGDILDTFIEAGRKHGARIYEFLLFADKATVQKRAFRRGYKPGSLLTPEKVNELWERSEILRKQRPAAVVIDTTHLTADEAFRAVKDAVMKGQE